MPPQSSNEHLPDSYIADPSSRPVRPLSHDESARELLRAIHDTEEVLIQATTIFPFTPFPDSITVDRTKITATKRFFFRVAETISFRIEDILSVTCTVGPFFGGIKLVSRVMNNEQETTVGPFWRGDAEKIKRIIHGYVIAKQRGIDTSQLATAELTNMLSELGRDNHGS